MTSPVATGNRWAVLGFTLGALAVLAALSARSPALALINESPSLARGLYVHKVGVSPVVGDVVSVRQPGVARPYLRGLGMPLDILLLKRVAAGPGDRVCSGAGLVSTPTRTVVMQTHDRRGAALPVWTGCRPLNRGELFLLGDTPSSFDSRYFGPLPAVQVQGVYREVWTW